LSYVYNIFYFVKSPKFWITKIRTNKTLYKLKQTFSDLYISDSDGMIKTEGFIPNQTFPRL